jgi:CheY-like chemotaxis protein
MRLEDATPGKTIEAAPRLTFRPKGAGRRQKFESIGRLAGGVAHDINNLLTAIILNSDVLAEQLAGAKLGALAETTRMSAERAGDLTRHLLAFVRGQQLPPRPTDVNAAIAALAPMLPRLLGGHMRVAIEPEARPATVMLDPSRFESAILNLALNARDAMAHGGTLTIRAGNRAGEVLVEVCDDGVGMAPAVRERAFEPFFTTKSGGTGLGLNIVRQFVRQTGGRLGIDARAGSGTTVTLFLPGCAASAPAISPSAAPRLGPQGSESVLVVEEDRILRAHVEAALTDLGYRVRGLAAAPAAVLELCADPSAFDLLVTEVEAPGGISGVELATALQRRKPKLRVLYTSAYGVLPAMTAWLQSRPHSAFLAKPFRRRDLALAVRALLDMDANAP